MPPDRTASATQLYGQACLNCSKAKSKCVSRSEGNACERCCRLKKRCLPGKNIRAHNAEKNNTISRISRVESKLDGLVSRLEQNHVLQPVAHSVSPPPSSEDSPFSITGINPKESHVPIPLHSSTELSPEESLLVFREEMLKYFPFVHIYGDASWLNYNRPFLLKCIMAVSSQKTGAKIALGEEIKNTVIRRMYLEKNASLVNLDLLLGLLTLVAWGHDNMLHKTPASVSRFTQLTTSIAFDLRLNRPTIQESNMLPTGKKPLFNPSNSERTLEERRVVLGCWMLSSVVSSYFTQNDPMQWTPYMDECLRILAENPESTEDEVIVHQISLQRVVCDLEDLKQPNIMPLAFYLASLRHRVQDIKSRIPSRLMQDKILLSSVYFTEMIVSALVLNHSHGCQSLENLHRCLREAQSGIENFFEIPISEYTRTSFPFFTQLARSILVIFKLSILKSEFWDTSLVRNIVDVLQVLDQLLKNIDEAKLIVGPQGDDGFLDKASTIFGSVQKWCSSKFEKNDEIIEDEASKSFYPFPDETFFPLEGFCLEDAWLKEFLF